MTTAINNTGHVVVNAWLPRNEVEPIADESNCIGRDNTNNDATMATTRGTQCSTSLNS